MLLVCKRGTEKLVESADPFLSEDGNERSLGTLSLSRIGDEEAISWAVLVFRDLSVVEAVIGFCFTSCVATDLVVVLVLREVCEVFPSQAVAGEPSTSESAGELSINFGMLKYGIEGTWALLLQEDDCHIACGPIK
jgi:hypothetical protein